MALSKPARGRTVSAEFCLGDPDFCSCDMCGDKCPEYNPIFRTARDALNSLERNSMEDFQTPTKKQKTVDNRSGKENKAVSKKGRLSLKGKEKAKPEDRFSEITSDEALAKISKGYIPPNTEKNTAWSMRVFEQWQEARKARGNAVPQILQKPYDCTALSHWLALFVTEVRKADGGKYPPNSVYQILCGILRFMRKQDPFVPNFLDQKDGRFHELHGTCESVFRELRQDGVGANPQETPNISKLEENHLWAAGILGCSSPKALQRTVFFYSGKNFILRGGEEQRQLKPS